jgi:hypothetical protein
VLALVAIEECPQKYAGDFFRGAQNQANVELFAFIVLMLAALWVLDRWRRFTRLR